MCKSAYLAHLRLEALSSNFIPQKQKKPKPKPNKKPSAGENVRKRNPYILLVGM
jgi:hypothetical protein